MKLTLIIGVFGGVQKMQEDLSKLKEANEDLQKEIRLYGLIILVNKLFEKYFIMIDLV